MALTFANDLAIGLASWMSFDNELADLTPHFLPGGVGTDAWFSSTAYAPAYWNGSSSYLLLSSTALPAFVTRTPLQPERYVNIIAAIKSAVASNATVAQQIFIQQSAAANPATLTLTQGVTVGFTNPTSTNNLLALFINASSATPLVSITDDGGNVWTRQLTVTPTRSTHSTCYGYIYTTTAANPPSITTLTLTWQNVQYFTGVLYEISNAKNTDPIDYATGIAGFGANVISSGTGTQPVRRSRNHKLVPVQPTQRPRPNRGIVWQNKP